MDRQEPNHLSSPRLWRVWLEMTNTRAKGQRTVLKAIRYARTFPGTECLPIYQVSRFAQEQPFDLILFRPAHWLRLVEVRSNTWQVGKPQTRHLAALPGEGYFKQCWRFRDRQEVPEIRQWNGQEWQWVSHPWEADGA